MLKRMALAAAIAAATWGPARAGSLQFNQAAAPASDSAVFYSREGKWKTYYLPPDQGCISIRHYSNGLGLGLEVSQVDGYVLALADLPGEGAANQTYHEKVTIGGKYQELTGVGNGNHGLRFVQMTDEGVEAIASADVISFEDFGTFRLEDSKSAWVAAGECFAKHYSPAD